MAAGTQARPADSRYTHAGEAASYAPRSGPRLVLGYRLRLRLRLRQGLPLRRKERVLQGLRGADALMVVIPTCGWVATDVRVSGGEGGSAKEGCCQAGVATYTLHRCEFMHRHPFSLHHGDKARQSWWMLEPVDARGHCLTLAAAASGLLPAGCPGACCPHAERCVGARGRSPCPHDTPHAVERDRASAAEAGPATTTTSATSATTTTSATSAT